MYQITKESPPFNPSKVGRKRKYNFEHLEPGDCMKIPAANTAEYISIMTSLYSYKKAHNPKWQTTTRYDAGIVSVYRLAEIAEIIVSREADKPEKEKKRKVREGVTVTPKEDCALVAEYGKELTDACYDFLSLYKQEKNYKTKSDYLTIRRWVIEAVKRQHHGTALNNTVQPVTGTSTARIDALKKW